METLMLPFSPRFIVLTICAVVTALLFGLGLFDHKLFDVVLIPLIIFAALTLLGLRDLTQKNHAILRNYPIAAHMRFLLEEIRPEMRQYFFESEKDGMPFSRAAFPARQDGARQASVRHPGRRLPRRLRVDASFGRAETARRGEIPHHR